MDDSQGSKDGISRRALLTRGPVVTGMAVSFWAVTKSRVALAQAKLSHEVAKYQDTPKDGQQCSTCLQFDPPDACKIVESPIRPQGWCQFYAKKAE